MFLHIDADSLLHAACWIAQPTTWICKIEDKEVHREHLKADMKQWIASNIREGIDHTLDKEVEVKDFGLAVNVLKSSIKGILNHTKPDDYAVYIGGGHTTFRHAIASGTEKEYKANRQPKPYHFEELEAYARNMPHIVVATDWLETDDYVTMCFTQMQREDYQVLVHIDKDLDQLPGLHYNWSKEKTYHNTFKDCMYALSYQMLVGDGADTVAGCKGIGVKKAPGLLQDKTAQEMWDTVQDLYLKAHGAEASLRFRHNIKMYWMLRRHGEFWTPDVMQEWLGVETSI